MIRIQTYRMKKLTIPFVNWKRSGSHSSDEIIDDPFGATRYWRIPFNRQLSEDFFKESNSPAWIGSQVSFSAIDVGLETPFSLFNPGSLHERQTSGCHWQRRKLAGAPSFSDGTLMAELDKSGKWRTVRRARASGDRSGRVTGAFVLPVVSTAQLLLQFLTVTSPSMSHRKWNSGQMDRLSWSLIGATHDSWATHIMSHPRWRLVSWRPCFR